MKGFYNFINVKNYLIIYRRVWTLYIIKRLIHIQFFSTQGGKKMAKIIKFVYVMILFLVVAEDIGGKPSFYPSQFFFLLHNSYTLFYHVFSNIILFSFLIIGNCECIRDEDCFKQKRDEYCHKEYCMIFFVHKCENYKCVCAGMFNWLYVY